jgi:hypothetical protein
MGRRKRGIRQVTALLVLAIVTAATGLPHWHTAPTEGVAVGEGVPAGLSSSPTAFLISASAVDLLECVVCILQRTLAQAHTKSTEGPTPLSPQAVVAAPSIPVPSTPPLRFADPRGPPTA